ncbi:hypothetical protein SAMN05519104_8330 [Rhizobiales bacterium GAS188]|nr:hypothetical protein SAMN05519104_8330 [Rhizobiales bacterium GAS188]
MSAQTIFDTAPLGALVRYCDGRPQPPARFTKKLAEWERSNGIGRLIRKAPKAVRPSFRSPASITLHQGDLSRGPVVVLTIQFTFSVTSNLVFEVIETPMPGSMRVLRPYGDHIELLYLAPDRRAAEIWLRSTPYCDAVFEEVGVDEPAAVLVSGRAA